MLKLMLYSIKCALRHPRTPICSKNPGFIYSAIPWWGSIFVLLLGIVAWCVSAYFKITGLDEAGRAMVYIPMGNLFGMSYSLNGIKRKIEKGDKHG